MRPPFSWRNPPWRAGEEANVEVFEFKEKLLLPELNAFFKSPYLFLILGVISISAAAVFTFTGKVWVRFNGWVYRAKEPWAFWGEVAAYYFVGVCLVGFFLYKVYGLSN